MSRYAWLQTLLHKCHLIKKQVAGLGNKELPTWPKDWQGDRAMWRKEKVNPLCCPWDSTIEWLGIPEVLEHPGEVNITERRGAFGCSSKPKFRHSVRAQRKGNARFPHRVQPSRQLQLQTHEDRTKTLKLSHICRIGSKCNVINLNKKCWQIVTCGGKWDEF